jgi:hypothetical protein
MTAYSNYEPETRTFSIGIGATVPSQEHLVSLLGPQFAGRISVAHGDGQESLTVYESYQLVLGHIAESTL